MKLRDLDYTDSPLNAEHQALGLPPIERDVASAAGHPVLRVAMWSVLLLMAGVIAWLGTQLLQRPDSLTLARGALHSDAFWWAVAVGLLAQTVDGALGMAYGITSTSFLLATGSSPAVASASVHIAEVFTTGVSGISHIKLGNVNRHLFLRLLLPGAAGAVMGAWLVTSIDGSTIKPFVSAYLLVMGLYVLGKAYRHRQRSRQEPRHVARLGLLGGFVDAVGGGGWGPVVTTTLVGTGQDPRTTIGSVNLAEFFLTFVSAGLFTLLVDGTPWSTVAGLVVGGLFAAPLAALLTRRLHTRILLVLVGSVIVSISLFNLWQALA
ncbi:MAG TPA: sulfite exporter TauE/SafE family protein [Rubrivivax sp.]|nr:sulfite exporter TauE/SafE family protein [Rubrivivax sp.]